MSVSRVAAGAGTALLVVGAVVVFKPSPRLSAESFVSAAFTNTALLSVTGNTVEIDKLPVCTALTSKETVNGAAPADIDQTAQWVPAAGKALYVHDKPCICGKFAVTTSRQCEATGTANPKGQSYLPRCDDFNSYIGGCWCGADAEFTTANLMKSIGPGTALGTDLVTTGVCPADKPAKCGDNYCIPGETCTITGTAGACRAAGAAADSAKRLVQKYAWAIPKIAGWDDKKIKICQSTVLQKKKCTVVAATAQTPNKPECKDA